jgi:hypothetical protein
MIHHYSCECVIWYVEKLQLCLKYCMKYVFKCWSVPSDNHANLMLFFYRLNRTCNHVLPGLFIYYSVQNNITKDFSEAHQIYIFNDMMSESEKVLL